MCLFPWTALPIPKTLPMAQKAQPAVTGPCNTRWAHCDRLGLAEPLGRWPAGTVALHPGWARLTGSAGCGAASALGLDPVIWSDWGLTLKPAGYLTQLNPGMERHGART